MTTNEYTPNEQFDELLDALWAGELDRQGEAMLESLAAAHPELAERLRRERAMSSMLAAKGPSRTPEGLAKAVFARLDQADQKKEESKAATVITRSSWATWFRPQLRWGLAAAALLVVCAQTSWLIYLDRDKGTGAKYQKFIAAAEASRQIAMKAGQQKAQKAALAESAKSARAKKSPGERMIAAVTTPAPTPPPKPAAVTTPSSTPAPKPAAVTTPGSTPTPKPAAVTTPTSTPAPKPAEAETETRLATAPKPEATVQPGSGAWRPKPPRFDPKSDERVIAAAATPNAAPAKAAEEPPQGLQVLVMQITLPSATASEQPVQPPRSAGMVDSAMKSVSTGMIPNRGIGINSFAPRQESRGEEPKAVAATTIVSHSQIQQAIMAAGGSVRFTHQTRVSPPAYRIEGFIPQTSVTAFVEKLGQMGMKRAGADSAQSSQYSIVQGEDLLQVKPDATTPTQRATNRTMIPVTLLVDESRR